MAPRLLSAEMCGINFFLLRFGFRKKLGFGSVWVWFDWVQKPRFALDITVIYYSRNSKYYNDRGWHDFDVTDVTHNNDNR